MSLIHFQRKEPLLALLGNPNCGKTALFNNLTGSRQKVANYAGVTVERKEGILILPTGKKVRVLDLPGTYSLYPHSPDETVTCNVLLGQAAGEERPDLVACIIDATNLRRGLHLVLAAKRLGLPCVVVLNMMDVARRQGLTIDLAALSQTLEMPVVDTVATERNGARHLRDTLAQTELWQAPIPLSECQKNQTNETHGDHQRVQDILNTLGLAQQNPPSLSDKLDHWALHPVWGTALLALILFVLFQSVFVLAEVPKAWIESGASLLGTWVTSILPEHWLRSLLVDGIIAGIGGVLAFLPQILILFFFILFLEESGYLPRAAFLLDRLMEGVGLSGRSFIPLLSCFACAIPGIMATRSIANPRDRLITIMLAPLMTCSARLPVYALLIGAFVPSRSLWGFIDMQGLTLFVLYMAGILAAMAVAWLLKYFAGSATSRTLMLELPRYHLPTVKNMALGLYQRATIFIQRVGTIIMALTIVMWVLSSYPAAPPEASVSKIEYSYAGQIGKAINPIFAPLGFNWQISVALIPGMAAREVMISALATVYALSDDDAAVGDAAEAEADEDQAARALKPIITKDWSLATAFALLAWYIFAPQCFATLAAIRRETNTWRMPLIAAAYLFGLAYLAAFITFRSFTALGFS